MTGIGRYALELARGVRGNPRVSDVKFFSAYRWVDDPDQALSANRLLASIRRSVPLKGLALKAYLAGRDLWFRRSMKGRFGDYLLHSPNYLLMRHAGPSVVTIHDFSWLHFPEHHPRERVELMNREMPRVFAEATCFITDSEFVRGEVISIGGVRPDKVYTVPLGVDRAFRPLPVEETAPILQRYGLCGRAYLLAVATIEPRKNLARLLQAYSTLPVSLRRKHPLVLVGVRGWHTEAIEQVMAPLLASGELVVLGYVTEGDLPALYSGAHAFAFVSLHEGFGLPLLEAMAAGVPCVTSNVSSLPEVGGEAALLVSPEQVESIREGLIAVLSDEGWRGEARLAGLARAAQHSWSACVENTIDVYERAIAA
nr:glycosyltransferase family 1 protein [Lysobacter sp. CAU 1642]